MTKNDDRSKAPRVSRPTGITVATNLKKHRLNRQMTFRTLAAAASKTPGYSISDLAISRIEARERKVDVDDLTALAYGLGIAPSTLLEPVDLLPTGIPEDFTIEDARLWNEKGYPLTHTFLADYWKQEAELQDEQLEILPTMKKAEPRVVKHLLGEQSEEDWVRDVKTQRDDYRARAAEHAKLADK